jgi:hypothetical protein
MRRQMSRLERGCPWFFASVAVAASIFLVWNLPPFMGADEIAHFLRADQGAHGRIVGERFVDHGKTVAGGPAELALVEAGHAFEALAFHPERKVSARAYRGAEGLSWGGSKEVLEFSGAAPYPPFFYLPASAAMFVGHERGWSVLDTLYAARLAQALGCIAVGCAALSLAGRSRLLIYSVLTLPMSLGLFATVTTDGLLIATTALGCALLCRAMAAERPAGEGELAAAAACFALAGMSKPPYALFALLLLAAPAARPQARWWAAGAALVAAFGWLAFTALTVQAPLQAGGVGIDPAGQIAFLLGHPLAILDIARQTLVADWPIYRVTMIGVLGWLDTWLAPPYYGAAWFVLALAVLASAPRSLRPWPAMRVTTLLVLLAVFGAIHLALYVTWTPVGAGVVQGVAGRYFLPLACVLALALESGRSLLPYAGHARWVAAGLQAAVLLFPLVSLAVMERAVVTRFYLG